MKQSVPHELTELVHQLLPAQKQINSSFCLLKSHPIPTCMRLEEQAAKLPHLAESILRAVTVALILELNQFHPRLFETMLELVLAQRKASLFLPVVQSLRSQPHLFLPHPHSVHQSPTLFLQLHQLNYLPALRTVLLLIRLDQLLKILLFRYSLLGIERTAAHLLPKHSNLIHQLLHFFFLFIDLLLQLLHTGRRFFVVGQFLAIGPNGAFATIEFSLHRRYLFLQNKDTILLLVFVHLLSSISLMC